MRQLRKQEVKKFFKKQKREKEIVLILENLEYARNVAGIFRTVDAAGISKLYLTGVTQTPPFGKELRNTSRNKERSVNWEFRQNTLELIQELKQDNFTIVAIELTDKSIPLDQVKSYLTHSDKICLIAGSEMFGVTKKTLAECDLGVYIPMYGKGGSLNVGVSVGIVLYSV